MFYIVKRETKKHKIDRLENICSDLNEKLSDCNKQITSNR